MEFEQIINTPSDRVIRNQCAAGEQSFCGAITCDAAGTLNGGALFAVARSLSLQELQGVELSASDF